MSWQETVQLNNGSLTDHASSSFYGYSLGLMWEHFFLLRHGFAILGQGLSGHAGFGNGVQGQITEHFDGTPRWWGILLSAHYVYRLSSSISLSLGPIVLSRFVSIPTQPSGSPSQNFSSEDIGFVASLRLRLFAGVELQQTLGSLTNQASTIWSLGLGYRF